MSRTVSIIIPTYKGNDKLPRALDSVYLQTYPNIEVIVVDDNEPLSEERCKTEKIINKYVGNLNLKYICHPCHMNGSAARNTGLRHASGYYISFLDDDDFYFPQKTANCVSTLEKSEECDGVLCQVVKCDMEGKYTRFSVYPQEDMKDPHKSLLINNNFLGSGSNLFVTRHSIEALNGFDERFIRYQDVEFMLRFFREYKVAFFHQLQVVKAMNGTCNIPPFADFLQACNQLIMKFKDDINQLDLNDRRCFYRSHYGEILRICSYKEDYSAILQIFDILKSNHVRLYQEYLYFASSRIKINNVSLYEKLKNINSRMKDKRNNKNISKYMLTEKEHQFIQNYLISGGC